jgi:hypothetical protein
MRLHIYGIIKRIFRQFDAAYSECTKAKKSRLKYANIKRKYGKIEFSYISSKSAPTAILSILKNARLQFLYNLLCLEIISNIICTLA